jgi:hypothetical protein
MLALGSSTVATIVWPRAGARITSVGRARNAFCGWRAVGIAIEAAVAVATNGGPFVAAIVSPTVQPSVARRALIDALWTLIIATLIAVTGVGCAFVAAYHAGGRHR